MSSEADFELVVGLFAVSASVLYGAGAVWALCGRQSLLGRWLLLCLALTMPLRISANEIFVVHALQVASVVLLIKAVPVLLSRIRSKRDSTRPSGSLALRIQVTIRGLMLATLVFALLVDNLRHMTMVYPHRLLPACILGIGLGTATLIGAVTIWNNGWPWLRWPACSLAGFVIGMIVGRVIAPYTLTLEHGPFDRTWFLVFPSTSLFIAVQLYLLQHGRLIDLRSLAGHSSLPGPFTPFARTSRSLAVVGAIVVVSILGFAMVGLATPLDCPTADLPTPNAYEVFVRAGKTLTWNFQCPWWRATQTELQDFCELNQRLLKEVHQHIHEPSLVPVPRGIDGNATDLTHLRELGNALLAQAKLAMRESRDADAAAICTNAAELGVKTARGGLPPDLLTGCRLEANGLHALCGQIAFGKGIDYASLLEQLKRIDTQRESLAEVMRRDEYWTTQSNPWWNRFAIRIGKLVGTYPDANQRNRCDLELRMRSAKLRLLLTIVALETFRAEQRRFPTELGELCPRLLDPMPTDPFDPSRPLTYRLDDGTYLLYSVGENGVDDGGCIGNSVRGDLFLDAVWSTTRVVRLGSGNLLRQAAAK